MRITLRRGKCPINAPNASQRATTLPSLGATGAGWRECGAIGAITGHLEHCVIIAPNSINPGLCPARNDETADPKTRHKPDKPDMAKRAITLAPSPEEQLHVFGPKGHWVMITGIELMIT